MQVSMELRLSEVWLAAVALIGFEITAFSWRLSREVSMTEENRRSWIPIADYLNLLAIVANFVGVFLLPLLPHAQRVSPVAFQIGLGVSVILFAGYPFAIAGHYELFTSKERSYAYAPTEEITVVAIVVLAAIVFVGLVLQPAR